jgi:hypothetical protein
MNNNKMSGQINDPKATWASVVSYRSFDTMTQSNQNTGANKYCKINPKFGTSIITQTNICVNHGSLDQKSLDHKLLDHGSVDHGSLDDWTHIRSGINHVDHWAKNYDSLDQNSKYSCDSNDSSDSSDSNDSSDSDNSDDSDTLSQDQKNDNTRKPFAIVKYFNKPGITESIRQVLMNGHLLPGYVRALKHLMKSVGTDNIRSIYVLNMMYDMVPGIRDKTGDTQPFMTESVEKSDKNSHETVIHGIREELRMIPRDQRDIKFLHKDVFPETLRTVDWYQANVKDLKVSVNLRESEKRPEHKKVGKNKVACIVWGSYQDLRDILLKIPTYSKRSDGDGITGIVCVEMSHMLGIIDTILRERYHGLDKFYWYPDKTHKFAFSGRTCTENEPGTQ